MTNTNAEQQLKEQLVKAIASGITNGLGTGAVVITVMELARVVLEGSLVACQPDLRAGLTQHLVGALDVLKAHIKGFTVPEQYGETWKTGEELAEKEVTH